MTITKMKTIGIVSIALILAATVVGAVAYHLIPAPARPEFELAKNPVGENAPRPAEKKENGETNPPTLADRFHALVAARSAGVARWSEQVAAAQTDADRAAIKPWTDDEYSRKMWALVVEAPNDPVVPEILCRIVVYNTWSDSTPLALRRLHRDQVMNPRIGPLLESLASSHDPSVEGFLRAVKAENLDPTVRARAALALAVHLRWQVLQVNSRSLRGEGSSGEPSIARIPLSPADAMEFVTDVETICKDIIARYPEEPWVPFYPNDKVVATTMGKKAREVLESLGAVDARRLAPGCSAPELTAIDSAGKEFNLSEFRGKVVLLSFDTRCRGGACRMMVPQKRELVKRFESRPFAVLAFDPSTENEEAGLKEFLAQEKVTWRVCPGLVNDNNSRNVWAWSSRNGPVMYLIDDQGVIRQRFGMETESFVLSAAVDWLVREAEERGRPMKSK